MKKGTKKIMTIIGVLAALAGGAYYYFFIFAATLKDKDGNTFRLDKTGADARGNCPVYVNGAVVGNLVSVEKGSDGLVRGVNADGGKYVWNGGKWNYL